MESKEEKKEPYMFMYVLCTLNNIYAHSYTSHRPWFLRAQIEKAQLKKQTR